MKKLSMILTVLVIFGSSAIGHTSDECVIFEGRFERSTRRPVAQFEYFQALKGEAIVKVYNEAGGRHAKKVRSAAISINGNKVVRCRDFYKKRFFRFWHHRKQKFFRCSRLKPQNDYIEKTVELTQGRNSLEVMLNSRRGGKIKVVIVKPKFLASDDSDCDIISDNGYADSCTGGENTLCNDNCPNDFNPDQADSDGDGIGDVCDDSDGYPNIVVATIPVGDGPYGGIAVSPDGEFAYVSNYISGTVSAIKTIDKTVIDIPVGAGPAGVSVTPGGAFVYVSNYNSSTVSVIDTSTHTVIDTIPVGAAPFGISVTPDGAFAYVSNYFAGNTVSVIDTSTHTVIDTIDVGNIPAGVSVTPDGAYVYVSNYGSGTVSVIDTSENEVIESIFVGDLPSGVSVTPDGAYAYVTIFGSSQAKVIRTSDYEVLPLISVEDGPDGVSVTPNGAYAYVNNSGSDSVSVIQTSDNTVLETIPVGQEPYSGIAVSPDGKFVYVANYADGTVSVIGF